MKTSLTPLVAALFLAFTACGDNSESLLAPNPQFGPGAAAGAVPFEAWSVDCGDEGSDPGELVVTGQGEVLHFRRIVGVSRMVSDNSLVAGLVIVNVDVTINTRNGAGSAQGSFELFPTGVDGSWVAHFGAHLKGGRFDGDVGALVDSRMIAQGTGELKGMKLMFDHFAAIEGAQLPDPPEGCSFHEGPAELWKGVIVGG